MTPTEATTALRNALPKDPTDDGPIAVPARAAHWAVTEHDIFTNQGPHWTSFVFGFGAVLAGFALGRRSTR